MPTNTVIPDPGAAWCNPGAGRWGPVGDFGIAVATTISEENTHFDRAFIVCAGNVECQTRTSVRPDRRSDQSTQEERNQMIKTQAKICRTTCLQPKAQKQNLPRYN